MRKPLAVTCSAFLTAMGAGLLVLSAMSGTLRAEHYRDTVVYCLGGFFLLLLLMATVFPWFAARDYRKVLTVLLSLEAMGMLLLFIFFGIMWMLLGETALGVFLRVLPALYGAGMVTAGVITYLMSREAYRPFMFEFFRQLPYTYYRYRT